MRSDDSARRLSNVTSIAKAGHYIIRVRQMLLADKSSLEGRLAFARYALDLAIVGGHDATTAGMGTATFTWVAAA